MNVNYDHFGRTEAGEDVAIVTLASPTLTVKLLTFGAIIKDLRLAGVPYPLTLGCDELAAYEGPMRHFGAVVGPVANRIANAQAEIDGVVRHFPANEHGQTTLHGGSVGLHRRIWEIVKQNETLLKLRIDLEDGLDGFPGNRTIDVQYEITGAGQLTMTAAAKTDAATPINLANHSYWNLNGTTGTAGHHLQIAADQYLPTDSLQIPTGEARNVAGTVFDFRTGRGIGSDQSDRFDHTFCLSREIVPLRRVATLSGNSGLSLDLETTERGLQVYDAVGVNTAPYKGHSGFIYEQFSGIAMESQGWPDAPNQLDFPQITLLPGHEYRQVTRWTFRNT
jgi:aldose 1-epimerase